MSSVTALQVLESAIADIGVWSWWAGDLSKALQIEFGRVLLWLPPTGEGKPPANQLALLLRQPRTILFLSRSDEPPFATETWPQQFHDDALGTFGIDTDHFTLTDPEQALAILAAAKHIVPLVGERPQTIAFATNTLWIAFWAGPVGLFAVAPEGKWIGRHGEVLKDDIPQLHQKWWDYWQEYWQRRDSETPMPYDVACEITIPLGDDA